jgi:hypothetical protein
MTTNTTAWKFNMSPRVVPPEEMRPDEAQQWCNFTLLMPGWLPSDCRVVFSGSLRKEAPPGRTPEDRGRPGWTQANPSSFSFTGRGNGRQLRIKQFLYDWAPPALDHPSLWDRPDRPFSVDSKRVGWIGTDYKGHTAATAILWGTMCEASVMEGTFSDTELTRIFQEIHFVDEEAKDKILNTPFASLCYWGRYQCSLVGVPFGMWKYRRSDPNLPYRWFPKEAVRRTLASQLPAKPDGWQIDSVCVLGDPGTPDEIEGLYVLGNRDRYVWCRTIYNPGKVGINIPPQPDVHSCKTEILRVGETNIHHAWIDDHCGPHDAIWQANDRIHMIQCNSAVGFDVGAFMKLVLSVIAQQELG